MCAAPNQPARPPAWAANGITAKCQRTPASGTRCLQPGNRSPCRGHQGRSRWPSSMRSHQQGRQTATQRCQRAPA
eukprot:4232740-Alexandrium_andersonii.AAC.1